MVRSSGIYLAHQLVAVCTLLSFPMTIAAGAAADRHHLYDSASASNQSVRSSALLPDALAGDGNGINSSIQDRLRAMKLAIFLDYDGTLSQTVTNPDLATITDAMRSTLGKLVKSCSTSIVTGREMSKIRQLLGDLANEDIIIASNHGQVIRMDGNEASAQLPHDNEAVSKAHKKLALACGPYEGIRLEHKGPWSVTVHYRQINDQQLQDKIFNIVEGVVNADQENLELKHGLKVWEVYLKGQRNKGGAIRQILQQKFQYSSPIVSLCIGDDTTDEDAFKVVNELSPPGISILVTDDPKNTSAQYTLKNPLEVEMFLRHLC